MEKNQKILRMVEGAVLLAVATVLSMIKLLDLPYGGSITACSALPLLLIAYRHGTAFGIFSGFVYGLIQLVLGMNTLSYVTTPLSIAAVILLDYVLAFMVMGLGGMFRKEGRSQGSALVLGALLTGSVRYVFHVISGCTVWAGLSIPSEAALLYSLAYNATYMLPETLVAMLGAFYFSRAVDIGGERPTRAVGAVSGHKLSVWALLGYLSATVAAVWDIVLIFAHLQDAESGDFVIQGLAQVNWSMVGIVTGIGAVLSLALFFVSRRCNKAKTTV